MGLVMNTVQINEYCSWAMNNIIRFTLVCVHECGYVECVCVYVCLCVCTQPTVHVITPALEPLKSSTNKYMYMW